MRIKKIRFKNGYKRFNDLTIDLGDVPARIVALVGPNGCGKSSVLDGLMFHAISIHAIGATPSRDQNYHSMSGIKLSRDDIDIEFDSGNYLSVYSTRETTGKHNTIFSFRSSYRYNSELKIKQTLSVPEIKLNTYGAGDASSIDSKMDDNYRRLLAKYNNHRDKNNLRPSEALNDIIGDLNLSIKKCLDIEIINLGNVEGGCGTIYFKKTDHQKEFEFDVLSSGEKEVIDILLDLYLRKDDYDETIFLIDEPELHINTSIQSNLLLEINRLVGSNCQIWLTTHSIGILRALQTTMKDNCQIIQFKPEDNLASQACTLRPLKVGHGTWRKIFDIALDDLCQLLIPKTIIYCEGKYQPGQDGRERGMDAQALNNIFAASHPEVLFISSGGNTELDQRSTIALAILSKVVPTVEILVLKDRDMGSGKFIDENDRQVYLQTHQANHRVLKRWELENYLYDKAVLQAYCEKNSLTFDETNFDKFVTDITNQNLKDETGKIKNFCGIKSSIDPDMFKINLSSFMTSEMPVFEELRGCIFDPM